MSETNPVGSIVAGMSYQNVFNVGDSEKEMLELTVEMGGTDVTGSCVVMAEDNASAQIKMASVTEISRSQRMLQQSRWRRCCVQISCLWR